MIVSALIAAPGCTLVISTDPLGSAATQPAPDAAAQVALPAYPIAAAASPTPIEAESPTPPPAVEATPAGEEPAPETAAPSPTPAATPSPPLPSMYDGQIVTKTFEELSLTPQPPTPTATATPLPTATAFAAPAQRAAVVAPTASPAAAPPVPTPSPTATPAATVASDGLAVYETAITISTYDYRPALVPTSPEDPVYPYPRLTHEQVGPPSPQSYRAVILENRYLQLTILPDLGGRIYRWIDKASGRNLFYENPVLKPTTWGHRGWWLAAGGMEWALPLDEHGLSEASPWDFQLKRGSDLASVTVRDLEEHTGLVSEVTISLDAGHAYFTLAPRISNPTAAPVAYKFWINGMFALGSKQAGPGLEFVLPGDRVTVHSTGDLTLPGEGEAMNWPVPAGSGRDLSDYGNWTKHLGVFAAPVAQAGYMGAYNHDTNLGVVRVFPHQAAPGAKIFAPGDLNPTLWTTDGSSYFELWGGLAPTFADEAVLEPGQAVAWQERWYAVGDVGGFRVANETAALNLGIAADSVQVAAAGTRPLNGQLILWQDGREATRWPVSLAPERPFRGSFRPPAGGGNPGAWGVSLVDETGREVAATGPTGAPAAASPAATPSPAPAAGPEPTPAAAPAGASAPVVWDPRLDELGITLNRTQPQPGQPLYRLVAARYWDESESDWLHHVFVEVIDADGRRLVGQPVVLAWGDGQSEMVTEDKPAPEYAANAPLYNYLGEYRVYVAGGASDVVDGLGLPGKHHVSYLLTFQRVGE